MTGYCYYSLLTGLESTRSGVTGMRWFDRTVSYGNFINYFGGRTSRFLASHIGHPSSPTLYEAAASGGWTASVSANYRRGVNVSSADSTLAMGLAKLKYDWWVSRYILSLPILRYWFAPSFAQAEDSSFKMVTSQLAGRPKVHWCVFGSTDSCMHVRGLGNEYEDALRHVDTLIGRYRRISEEMGTESQRYYAVLTDHGGANVSVNLDLTDVLSHAGLRAYQGKSQASDTTLSRPIEELSDTDVCIMVNGDTLVHMYFKHPQFAGAQGWHHRVTSDLLSRFPVANHAGHVLNIDVVAVLLNTVGVELVVTWDEFKREAVVRHSRGGRARIAIDSKGAVAYTLETDQDPLQFDACGAGVLIGRAGTLKYLDAAVWLEETRDCEFPYGPVTLYQLMSSPKGSDIVATALAGFDFGKDFERFIGNFRGGHGGARFDQLSVPYIIAGPGIRAGVTVSAARGEDIGATLLHLLTVGEVSPKMRPDTSGDLLLDANVDVHLWRGEVIKSILS